MATETQETTNVENGVAWDAARYEDALAHLEQLQEQVNESVSKLEAFSI